METIPSLGTDLPRHFVDTVSATQIFQTDEPPFKPSWEILEVVSSAFVTSRRFVRETVAARVPSLLGHPSLEPGLCAGWAAAEGRSPQLLPSGSQGPRHCPPHPLPEQPLPRVPEGAPVRTLQAERLGFTDVALA